MIVELLRNMMQQQLEPQEFELNLVMQEEKSYRTMKIALISAIGNWVGDMILYPLDTISTRLKANAKFHHNPFTYTIKSIRTEGLSLYRGFKFTFPASFLPTFIYVGIYDGGMRGIQRTIHFFTNHDQVKLLFPFFVSSIAEMCSLFLYMPVDTVRTRVQMNKPEYSYQSFWEGLSTIQRKEGHDRFLKSSKVYFACKTLYTAIQFQSFETLRYFVGPSFEWLLFNTVVSTAIATTLLNPLEVLITRSVLMDTSLKKLRFAKVASTIYKGEGFLGFYKGYGTELVLHVLYALFWLPLFQVMREKYGLQLPE